MREVRIFLASSYELEPDRARIGNLIREMNDTYYEAHGIHLHLVKWEDLDSFYNLRGKQSEYDSQIRNCELFIGLFWHIAGRYTIHEVEVARQNLKRENIFIFRKTAEFKPDHEGSEDVKRFLEQHPEESADALKEGLDEFLEGTDCQAYPDFGVLRRLLAAKLADYCGRIEVTEEDRKHSYSADALQIHVAASPEAEPDLARLGDLVRCLDENSKHCCRIRLVRGISGSDMFVSLCHISAPDPMPDEIQTAIDCNSAGSGRPRLYFSFKYVPEDAKQQSLKELEEKLRTVFSHYPDRYSQAAEMKLHFLMQLEILKKNSGGMELAVKDGMICQQLGGTRYPLMSCEDMAPLQKDPAYRSLKAERARLLDEIEKLKERDRQSGDDLSEAIYRLNQELADIGQQIDDKRNGYLRLARTLEEYVGKEQDEQIAEVRELISRGMIDQALKLLPDSRSQRRERDERRQRRREEDLRAYEVCKLTIACLGTSNMRKNRDEMFSLCELRIDIAAEDLRDPEKEADSCLMYGHGLVYFGNVDRALTYFERALAVRKELLGEDHPAVAYCYHEIGAVWADKDDSDRALPYYEKALAIWKKVLGEDDPRVATAYNNIGMEWGARGDSNRALEYLEKALAIREKVLGKEHRGVAYSYHNIGWLWEKKGGFDRALEYYEKALAILEKALGKDHPDVALSYNNIGSVWGAKGDSDRALEYHEKALAILEKVLGKDHPDTADSCNNIGMTLYAKDDDRALTWLERAASIWEQVLGANHSRTATCYNNIVLTLEKKGDLDRMLFYLEKSLAAWQKVRGENHPRNAFLYYRMGKAWDAKKDYDWALSCFEKALAIWEKELGEESLYVHSCLVNISSIWKAKGDPGKAREYYDRAMKQSPFHAD